MKKIKVKKEKKQEQETCSFMLHFVESILQEQQKSLTVKLLSHLISSNRD